MFHSCLISSKFIYTISFPILSCLYDNKPPFAQMCCNSCLFLCAELLEGPHTEKLHLSSPLPLSHQLQKRAKRALHNRVIPQESANPALIIMKSFFFFFKEEDAELLLCGYAAHTGQAETGALQIVLILAAALSRLTTKAD